MTLQEEFEGHVRPHLDALYRTVLGMAPMRPVAWGSLMGHLVYGLVLGAAFVPLHRPLAPAAPGLEVRRRPTEVVRG